MEKISVIDMDPFIIPQPKYTPEDDRVILKLVSVRRNTSRISEAYLRTIAWSQGLLCFSWVNH